MMGKQHVQFATITAIGSYILLKDVNPDLTIISNSIYYFGGAILGSLLPDIDKETSIIGQVFWPISKLINKIFGHRTITHDILLWMIVAIVSTYYYPFLFGLWFGYIGHLILDSFTKKCIIWGYFIHPNLRTDRQYGSFKDGYFYLLPECMRFYANSKIANVFTIGSALLFVYGMYWYLANQPLNMLLSMIS